ncbi:MAG: YqeG family HAD IIIA-type phosphatase [Clostridiales bacterium]|nr:YqeG family HAD IIIA-type phosphatase [Clostridiales bacterium]
MQLFSRYFKPTFTCKNIFDIDLSLLNQRKIRLLILDIDKTLGAIKQKTPSEDVIEWLEHAKSKGFLLYIMSNNRQSRVKEFAENLDIPFIYKAMKPLKLNFKRIINNCGVTPEQTCMVGDKYFTDILGANRMGFCSVLVDGGYFNEYNK